MAQQLGISLFAVIMFALAAGDSREPTTSGDNAAESSIAIATADDQFEPSLPGQPEARRSLRVEIVGVSDDRMANRDHIAVREFPVADLIAGPPHGGPAFRNPTELIRLLRGTTGNRHWRKHGRIEWLERRQLLRVENDASVVSDVARQLARLRNVGPSHVDVTVRVLVVPRDSELSPRNGTVQLNTSAHADKIWKTWRDHDRSGRNHEADYVLRDRDIVYAWTSKKTAKESQSRGLNVVVETAADRGGAKLTPYPFTGDEQRVDWPDVFVGVGQTAVFDAPMSAAAPDDDERVLIFVSVNSMSPSAK